LWKERVWLQVDQFSCVFSHPVWVASAPANFDSEIIFFRPPQRPEGRTEGPDKVLCIRIAFREAHQDADYASSVRFLRSRQVRPDSRAADDTEQLAPSHPCLHGPRMRHFILQLAGYGRLLGSLFK
jgi:hypothetical protein